MHTRLPKQYKYFQKSKFQDKRREETDKGEENIPENSVSDRIAIGIKTKYVSI